MSRRKDRAPQGTALDPTRDLPFAPTPGVERIAALAGLRLTAR